MRRRSERAILGAAGELEKARAAADDEQRLRHLVAAWRVKPAAEIATAISALGAKLDRARPRLAGRDKQHRFWEWIELQKDHDDVLTGWLLSQSYLGDLHRFQDPCMRVLPRWPRDPRLTDAMLAQLAPRVYVSLNAWAPMWSTLRASNDPRAIAVLRDWIARPGPAPQKRAAQKVVAALEKKFPKGVPALTADEKRLLGGVDEGADRDAELLAAIWSSANDDGPRLVYADFLQERGDPRGEFIMLQCERALDAAKRARMRELKNAHWNKWLGPLRPAVLETKTVQFERGFLALCTVCAAWGYSHDDADDPRERAIRALMDHPAWSTLREVRITRLAKRTRAPLLAHLARLGVTVKFVKG